MIGWGTTFHIPAVLSAPIAAGTRLPEELVFGGITLMLLVAAAIAPAVGRALDRDGCRRWTVIGSALMATGLGLLAAAEGPALFALAWGVLGLAMPLALNQAASTALVQIAPDRARRGIALLLLFSGFSSTIAWPVLIWLNEAVGWRAGMLVFAATHLLVCAPLHFFGLPAGRPFVFSGGSGEVAPEPASEPPPGAFALAAVTFSIAGMLTWGLPLHLIGLLRDFGHSEAAAVTVGALVGPGQVLARGFEMMGAARVGILPVGVVSMAMMPMALTILLLTGTTLTGAVAFTIAYGLSAGLISIVRAVAPLRIFGASAYATVLGRLNVPQNIAFAVAPLGFAVIRNGLGATALIWISLALGLVSLLTMSLLARRAR